VQNDPGDILPCQQAVARAALKRLLGKGLASLNGEYPRQRDQSRIVGTNEITV
jgi:hypothetical protein